MRTCAVYDATVKAMGFDEVRVRYQRQRKSIIRDVIDKNIEWKEIKDFIAFASKSTIPEVDRAEFIEDVIEDLEQIDESRLAGLGVTVEQLREWVKKR